MSTPFTTQSGFDPGARFHLAFPVTDLAAARAFYVDRLGFRPGRESTRWIDLDFFGHQVVAHLVDPAQHPSALARHADGGVISNSVDGHQSPAFHFGMVLPWDVLEAWIAHLRAAAVEFFEEPRVRFVGRKGEQRALFIVDPSGNHLEFKAFRRLESLFATDLEDYA